MLRNLTLKTKPSCKPRTTNRGCPKDRGRLIGIRPNGPVATVRAVHSFVGLESLACGCAQFKKRCRSTLTCDGFESHVSFGEIEIYSVWDVGVLRQHSDMSGRFLRFFAAVRDVCAAAKIEMPCCNAATLSCRGLGISFEKSEFLTARGVAALQRHCNTICRIVGDACVVIMLD